MLEALGQESDYTAIFAFAPYLSVDACCKLVSLLAVLVQHVVDSYRLMGPLSLVHLQCMYV